MGPCLHNEGLDAGVGEGRWRSRNLLLSLILHSPRLLIQEKPLNHDCVPSAEPAKNPLPVNENPKEQPPSGFQTHIYFLKLHIKMCVWVHAFIAITFSFHLDQFKHKQAYLGLATFVCVCISPLIM